MKRFLPRAASFRPVKAWPEAQGFAFSLASIHSCAPLTDSHFLDPFHLLGAPRGPGSPFGAPQKDKSRVLTVWSVPWEPPPLWAMSPTEGMSRSVLSCPVSSCR